VGKCETMDFYKQSHCCFLVDNSQNKKYLEKQILFFLKNFLKKI
jgi:hypothetical protein